MHQMISSAARRSLAAYDPLSYRAVSICRDCLPRTTSLASAVRHSRRHASNKTEPLTERLRRKIWKDEPPGPENVYGESQFFPAKKSQKLAPQKVDEDELGLESLAPADYGIREGLTAEKAKELDSSYEPASTWQGLDQVGGAKGWWEEAWDVENRFAAFRPIKDPSKLNKEKLFRLVRRAYIEAHILQKEGLDLGFISRLPSINYLPFHTIETTSLDSTPSAWLERITELVNSKEETDNSSQIPEPSLDKTDLDVQIRSQWYSLPLDDLALKFAVVKRLTQLTGARVSDATLTSVDTLGQLVREIEYKPPPKKTAEVLETTRGLKALPNVHIYADRQTWVDREKRLGRYKIIAEKLQERGLPEPQRRKRRA